MAAGTFCITIDTEPDCSTNWRRSDPLTFESVLVGIREILRPVWDEYAVKPVYFVSPEVAANKGCCEVLKEEIEHGAEIGAHLHSEYIEPAQKYDDFAGTASKEYPCFAYDSETELEKIENLTNLIFENVGVKPVSYRAARYGADLDTIKSLEKLDYKVDSSVTPDIDWSNQDGPDHSSGPKQPYFIASEDYYNRGNTKILEVPISISGKRLPFLPDKWLFYRWLRPSHMSVFEMKMLVNKFTREYDQPVLNMMFHSMEIIPGMSPFVRTRLGQKCFLGRLKRILGYLKKNRFQSKTLEMVFDSGTLGNL